MPNGRDSIMSQCKDEKVEPPTDKSEETLRPSCKEADAADVTLRNLLDESTRNCSSVGVFPTGGDGSSTSSTTRKLGGLYNYERQGGSAEKSTTSQQPILRYILDDDAPEPSPSNIYSSSSTTTADTTVSLSPGTTTVRVAPPAPRPPVFPGAYPQPGFNHGPQTSESNFTLYNASLYNEDEYYMHGTNTNIAANVGEEERMSNNTNNDRLLQTQLVEASPVAATSSQELDLEVADFVDTQAQESMHREKTEKTRALLSRATFWGAFLLIVTVSILVVTLVHTNNASTTPEERTLLPTSAPTLEALLSLLPPSTQAAILLSQNGNNATGTGTITTPQSMAYQWMLNDTTTTIHSYYYYSNARLLQRFSLAVFYYSTMGSTNWIHKGGDGLTTMFLSGPPPRAPNGPAFEPGGGGRPPAPPGGVGHRPGGGEFNFTGAQWLDYESHECDWLSTFRGPSPICRLDTDDNNTLIQILDIQDNYLSGSLPEEMGLLTSLRRIFLNRNSIGGALVTELGRLTNLQSLEVNFNQLTGTIPSQIGLLSTLGTFALLDNTLEGTIPSQVWRLTNLQRLNVAKNVLTGTLPITICEFLPKKLRRLLLADNQLSGSLPLVLASLVNCTSLMDISLGQNAFTGALPTQVGLLTGVATLDLNGNNLSGSIPSELGQLGSTGTLVALRLGNNVNLTGSLPTELGLLIEYGALQALEIQGTAVTGTIPSSLCNLRALEFDCTDILCGCDCHCGSNNATL